MADDHDFKAVRRNFFIINILIFYITLSPPDLKSLEIFGVDIELDEYVIYISFMVFYLYYAFRYYQEYLILKEKLLLSIKDEIINRLNSELKDPRSNIWIQIKNEIIRQLLSELDQVKLYKRDWNFDELAKRFRINYSLNKPIIIEFDNYASFVRNVSSRSNLFAHFNLPETRLQISIKSKFARKLKRLYLIKELRTNRQVILLFLPVFVSLITILAVLIRVMSKYYELFSH